MVIPSLLYIVQIADFGMSRNLIDENYYIISGGKIPVKWTAPEVHINLQLTIASIRRMF